MKSRKKKEKLNEIIKNNKKIIRILFSKKNKKRASKNFKVFLRKNYYKKILNNI